RSDARGWWNYRSMSPMLTYESFRGSDPLHFTCVSQQIGVYINDAMVQIKPTCWALNRKTANDQKIQPEYLKKNDLRRMAVFVLIYCCSCYVLCRICCCGEDSVLKNSWCYNTCWYLLCRTKEEKAADETFIKQREEQRQEELRRQIEDMRQNPEKYEQERIYREERYKQQQEEIERKEKEEREKFREREMDRRVRELKNMWNKLVEEHKEAIQMRQRKIYDEYKADSDMTERIISSMSVPSEYNVINGLLGLGEYILLEIFSELRLVSNAVQFLGVCKQTYQLMNHARFSKIIETLSYPINIINKDSHYIKFVDIDGVQKQINKKKDDYSTISLTQVLENGIWTLETMFLNMGGRAIGIVRDSYDIPANTDYSAYPHTYNIAAFCGGQVKPVWYQGQEIVGNAKFKDNQILRLEFDSFKGTLILFINNIQQPVYFSEIKMKVRFIISMNYAGSICIIRLLKKLKKPTSAHIANQKAIQW
ncbi:MAG: hypothetical protein EZS28_016774, partial [Streblomastix strix]